MSKPLRDKEIFRLTAVSLRSVFPTESGGGKPNSELELTIKRRRLYRTTPVWIKCGFGGKRKRPLFLVAFRNSLILMVPEAGIEPARRERRGILNPLCLPISPLGHRNRYQARVAGLSTWRHVPESNRTKRICNPLHNRFANAPCKRELALYLSEFGAGNETRTRDPDLGKVVLYQLSYSRIGLADCLTTRTHSSDVPRPVNQKYLIT